MKVLRLLIVLICCLGFNFTAAQSQNRQAVYELRTYTTHPGKLNALSDFFKNHTISIFNKYGMESVGYWIPVDTPNTLIYILKHENMKVAKTNWQKFVKDPDRLKAGEEAMKDGPIVLGTPKSVYMYATEYAPIHMDIER